MINLAGRAYQLEDRAYEKLQRYLAQAAQRLDDDPDKDEILSDLEQAIAEKCDSYVKGRTTVVSLQAVEKIIQDMGPVEPAKETGEHTAVEPDGEPVKRLHLLKDGAMIGGVCAGLSAFFNIDVTVIRLLFVLLTFLTGGSFILVYLILMFIIPEARTPEQKAEAHGERFNTNEVIGRAKQKYADMRDSGKWREVAERSVPAFSNVGRLIVTVVRIAAEVVAAFCVWVVVMMTVVLADALWLLTFGHFKPADQLHTIPDATVVVTLICIYYIVQLPFTLLAAVLRYYATGHTISKHSSWWATALVALWMIAIAVLITIGVVTASRVRAYEDTHARVRVYGNEICINTAKCDQWSTPMVSKPVPPPVISTPYITR